MEGDGGGGEVEEGGEGVGGKEKEVEKNRGKNSYATYKIGMFLLPANCCSLQLEVLVSFSFSGLMTPQWRIRNKRRKKNTWAIKTICSFQLRDIL